MESKAYISAMQALQRKVQILEEENRLYQLQHEEQLNWYEREIRQKEDLFTQLEKKLKDTIVYLEDEIEERDNIIQQKDSQLDTRDAEIESLKQELHQSLLEQSKIIETQVQDRQQIISLEDQVNKLKQVIHKLKEPRFSSEKKSITYSSKLEETVENFFSATKRLTYNEAEEQQNEYQNIIRRIQKLEDEIHLLEYDHTNQQLMNEKIETLQQLQQQEQSLLQNL